MEFNKTCTDIIEEKNISEIEINEKISNNLKKSFIAALKDTDAIKAFKYVKKICLWDEKYSKTNAEQELYKRARRDVWLMIREYIPEEKLIEIEITDKRDIFAELRK